MNWELGWKELNARYPKNLIDIRRKRKSYPYKREVKREGKPTLLRMSSGLPMLSPRTARSSESSLQASSRTLSNTYSLNQSNKKKPKIKYLEY